MMTQKKTTNPIKNTCIKDGIITKGTSSTNKSFFSITKKSAIESSTNTSGFTLTEVTIAMVIMGLGFGAIFNLNTIIGLSTGRAMERVSRTTHADYVLFEGRVAYIAQTKGQKDTKDQTPSAQKDFSTKVKLADVDQEATYKRTPIKDKSALSEYELVREEIIFEGGKTYITFISPYLLVTPIQDKKEKDAPDNKSAATKGATP
jgi:prepilin-type N-terminal cleavage/methylation domain-containing protein